MGAFESLRTAISLRTWIRRHTMAVLQDLGHPPTMDRTTGIGIRTVAGGLDPIRVLVFGGSAAVGWGVTTREEAFDGPLAQLLAEGSGRGVVLENRAVPHVHIAGGVDSLGPAGAHTFHVAMWFPSFAEGLEHLRLRRWRTDLHGMIARLRVDRPLPIVLAHMPVPLGMHPAAIAARPWVLRLNRLVDEVAAAHEGVVSVATEPFVARELGQKVTDAAYFAETAARLAPAVLAVLGVRPVAPAQDRRWGTDRLATR